MSRKRYYWVACPCPGDVVSIAWPTKDEIVEVVRSYKSPSSGKLKTRYRMFDGSERACDTSLMFPIQTARGHELRESP